MTEQFGWRVTKFYQNDFRQLKTIDLYCFQ